MAWSTGGSKAPRGGAAPPSVAPHDYRSFSVCGLSIALQTGVQNLFLCIHDDFDASHDRPVAVHLGRDAVSLGKPPRLRDARYVFDAGLLDLLDADEEEPVDEEEHKGPVEREGGEEKGGTPSLASHIRGSFSVCDLSIALATGIQSLLLCIHDDFVVSDSPIAVHLGHDAVSLGEPPPRHDARYIYDVGLLSLLGDDADQEEPVDDEHIGPRVVIGQKEEDGIAQGARRDGSVGVARRRRLQQKQRGRPRGVDSLLLDSKTKLDLSRVIRRFGLWFAVVFALLIVCFVVVLAPKFRRGPVPEHTYIKPLDPSPVDSFVDLLERHKKLQKAILDSGAIDYPAYIDAWSVTTDYCHELKLAAAADWSGSLYSPSRRTRRNSMGWWWQQWATGWRSWWTARCWQWWPIRCGQWWTGGKFRPNKPYYHGPAHGRLRELCDAMDNMTRGEAAKAALRLHTYVAHLWGYGTVFGLVNAARQLEGRFAAAREGTIPLLDAQEAFPTLGEGDPNQDGGGDRALNGSLAIRVLKMLSKTLSGTGSYFPEVSTARIKTLNTTLDRVTMLGAELLDPGVGQWLLSNRDCGGYIPPEADGRTPSRRQLKRLKRLEGLRDLARADISTLKDAQDRFQEPAAETLAVTGPALYQLKARMDDLIAGRGWTRLIRHQEQWVLDWYYLPLRDDLPAWLYGLAQNMSEQFARLQKDEMDRTWAESSKRAEDIEANLEARCHPSYITRFRELAGNYFDALE